MRSRWWKRSEGRAVNGGWGLDNGEWLDYAQFSPLLDGKPLKEGLETFLERFGIFSRKVGERV